jgi:primosomal replication protein N
MEQKEKKKAEERLVCRKYPQDRQGWNWGVSKNGRPLVASFGASHWTSFEGRHIQMMLQKFQIKISDVPTATSRKPYPFQFAALVVVDGLILEKRSSEAENLPQQLVVCQMQVHSGAEKMAKRVVLVLPGPRINVQRFTAEFDTEVGCLVLFDGAQNVTEAGTLLFAVFLGAVFVRIGGQLPQLEAQVVQIRIDRSRGHLFGRFAFLGQGRNGETKVLVEETSSFVDDGDGLASPNPQVNVCGIQQSN